MGRTRGAGAHLAGSRGSEAAVDLACVGPPFVGTSPAHGCWICHIRNLFHDPMWETKGEAVRRNIEREQGAYLGHASAASSPRLRCALAGRHHLSKREERAKNREIGRVCPSERIRTGNFFTCAGCVAAVSLVPCHSFHPLSLTRGSYQGWEHAGLIFRRRLEMDTTWVAGNSRLYIPAASTNRRICRGGLYYHPPLLCHL